MLQSETVPEAKPSDLYSTHTACVHAGFFILSNVLWGLHFWRDSWRSLEYIFGFLFLTTWIVPFSLFLSVAANESVLPGGANAGMTFSSSSSSLAGMSAWTILIVHCATPIQCIYYSVCSRRHAISDIDAVES